MSKRCIYVESNGFHHCGSYAFNLEKDGIEQGDLCDVHYWQDQALRAKAKLAEQPTKRGAISFNCSAGCGACGVKLQDFVTHQTQVQEGGPWVVVDSQPEVVSTCCGSPVEVWDEQKQDIVARIEALKKLPEQPAPVPSAMDEMWIALASYQPQATAKGHGETWAAMCKEKTADAVNAAWSASAYAAYYDASDDAAAAYAAAAADDSIMDAQQAIDYINKAKENT